VFAIVLSVMCRDRESEAAVDAESSFVEVEAMGTSESFNMFGLHMFVSIFYS
jgi:hypothetical protein